LADGAAGTNTAAWSSAGTAISGALASTVRENARSGGAACLPRAGGGGGTPAGIPGEEPRREGGGGGTPMMVAWLGFGGRGATLPDIPERFESEPMAFLPRHGQWRDAGRVPTRDSR
jgi:hypothetical protein